MVLFPKINGHIPFDHDHSECPQGGCVHCQEATSLCGAQCNTEADKKPMFYAQCYVNFYVLIKVQNFEITCIHPKTLLEE